MRNDDDECIGTSSCEDTAKHAQGLSVLYKLLFSVLLFIVFFLHFHVKLSYEMKMQY